MKTNRKVIIAVICVVLVSVFVISAFAIAGDVNNDGRIDSKDVVKIVENINGGNLYDGVMDINNDGVIDYRDAEMAQNIYMNVKEGPYFEPDDRYILRTNAAIQISTAEEFKLYVQEGSSREIVLLNNIYLGEWDTVSFSGYIDGRGYKITYRDKTTGGGLINHLDGTIINVFVEGNINGTNMPEVGLIANRLNGNAQLINSKINGKITVSHLSVDDCKVGGLVGMCYGSIDKCFGYSEITVDGSINRAGGAVGFAYRLSGSPSITNTTITTRIISTGDGWNQYGGLIGDLGGGMVVTNCAANDVYIKYKDGTAGGFSAAPDDGIVTNSYASGEIYTLGDGYYHVFGPGNSGLYPADHAYRYLKNGNKANVKACFGIEDPDKPYTAYTESAAPTVNASRNNTIAVSDNLSGRIITNKVSTLGFADVNSNWITTASGYPDDYFAVNFPFLEYAKLFVATGGTEQKDLFINPMDRAVLDDYDFTYLLAACDNVVRMGLKPYISMAGIPLKFVTGTEMNQYGANPYAPDDDKWDAYYDYLIAIGNALVERYGREEVLTWKFGISEEYSGDEQMIIGTLGAADPVLSREAVFKLYDYTVTALEETVGTNVTVGAHGTTVTFGLWDENLLIKHCALGPNYKTGKTGDGISTVATRIDFLASSSYGSHPNNPSGGSTANNGWLDNWDIGDCARRWRTGQNRKNNTFGEVGLNAYPAFANVILGSDENRFLNGDDGKMLGTRSTGKTFQGSYDARQIKQMVDNDIGYISYWGLTSNNVWGGVPNVAHRVAEVFHRMVGSRQLSYTRSGTKNSTANEVEAITAKNDTTGKVYVFVYNHNPGPSTTSAERITAEIPASLLNDATTATVTVTYVDDRTNWWDNWNSERSGLGITLGSEWSSENDYVTAFSAVPSVAHRHIIVNRYSYYLSRSALKPRTQVLTVSGGKFTAQEIIGHHGVVMFEFS